MKVRTGSTGTGADVAGSQPTIPTALPIVLSDRASICIYVVTRATLLCGQEQRDEPALRLMMSHEPRDAAGAFPSTHWTSIFLAGRPEEAAGQEALSRLLQKYRAPLLAHLLWRFQATEEQAEDWCHAFVEKKILEKQVLKCARRERGRFRTFLLNALDNFVHDQIRRDRRECRRPRGGFVAAEDLTEMTPAVAAAATDPTDVAWARAVLNQAVTRLREFYTARGRMDLWGVFHEGFVQPTLHETEAPSMSELAQRFGFQSASQASNGLVTAKRMSRQFLELVIAEYAEDESAVATEIRELMAILAGAT